MDGDRDPIGGFGVIVPRQRRPAKQMPTEQPSTIHRFARMASDWKAIISFILLAGGGVAFAMSVKFATKAELKPLQDHAAKHDEELSAIGQSLKDIRENQDREMQWLWDLKNTPRK